MRTLKFLSIVLIFFLGLSISAQEIKEIHTEDESYSREEILIKYRKDAVNLSSFTGRIKSRIHLAWNGLSREEDIQDGNITVARIDPDETIESTLAQLSGDARIEYAQPNYIYEINTLDTDDTHRLLLW